MVAALFLILVTISPSLTAGFDDTFRAGVLALQRNDLPTAEANLEAALKIQPTNARAWIALARTRSKLHDQPSADRAAASAASFGARDPVVLQSLAIYYFESGQPARAAAAQIDFAAAVPADAAARDRAIALTFAAAQPLLREEKFAEALPLLQRAPPDPQIQLALGVTLYGLRRFDESSAAFLLTIELAPEIDQPYLFLGKMLDQVPARLPAIAGAFARYEAAHPDSPAGYLLHAKALNAQSLEPAAAEKLLRRSLAISDADASAHFELATLLEARRDFPTAAAEFERAAALDPRDSATHYRLARVYDRLGQRDAAQAQRELHARLVKAQDASR